MDDQLHIIIAGDRGKVFKLPCSKKKLCVIIAASAMVFIILTLASICSFSLYTRNCSISNQIAGLKEKLHSSTELIAEHNRINKEQRQKLARKVALLERDNIEQFTSFKEEKASLLSNAVEELRERSELIERVIDNIGIKVSTNNYGNSKHSGGPFVEYPDSERDNLLFKADKYLDAIRFLPLGKPVKGPITSSFGKREDPFNHRSAFHTGIDFRGDKGEKVYATASGVVKKAYRNGGYGNYVLIDHGNGYTSSFAHMKKYLVHKGDRVKRGQLIGLVGNTGRSTGSHLHYEIALNDKTINPYKFLKVSSLTIPSKKSRILLSPRFRKKNFITK